MANGKPSIGKKHGLAAFIFACVCCAVLVAYLVVPEGASEEYKYTVLKVFQFGFLPLLMAAVICFFLATRETFLKRLVSHGFGWLALCLIGAAFIAVPVFSPQAIVLPWQYGVGLSICWVAGTFCLAIGLFLLAARLKNAWSGLLCLFASIVLAWFAGETAYLLTPQYGDGRWADAEHSKHVLHGDAVPHMPAADTPLGVWPQRPPNASGGAAHRELRYNDELFDVLYTLDDKNRRVTPAPGPEPQADLLIFGCSFAFGFGLDDKDTWPWILAEDLGPRWRVENYGYSGFGAQQMLTMLEEKKIDPPQAPVRQALFLGIPDQIKRNSGLFDLNTITYSLKPDGEVERSGTNKDSPARNIFKFSRVFNGSQLARELSGKAINWFVARAYDKQAAEYVGIIDKSSKVLRSQYGATLTVLLWPGMDSIAPALKEKGIPVIMAKEYLKDWDTKGDLAYHIVPIYEPHPNKKAAMELAAGLAAHYRALDDKTSGAEQAAAQ